MTKGVSCSPLRLAVDGGAGAGVVGVDEDPIEAELRLPEYDGTFSDYSAIVLQYGYITMFVSALPGVIVFAMAEVLLQIRTDRYFGSFIFAAFFFFQIYHHI